jgi:asparagine synthetase B (glutamine-hydrolysing)
MCGIVASSIDLSARAAEELPECMLVHRGLTKGERYAPGVGFGMRRLATDGQRAAAIGNETGDALSPTARFNSTRCGGTAGHGRHPHPIHIEVLVHATRVGIDSCRVRGMFALAFRDGRTKTLIAARDRWRKPAYWTKTSRGLLLASEVKAPLVRRRSRELIRGRRSVSDPRIRRRRGPFKGVHKLPPG